MRAHRSSELLRSLTLLRAFLVASAAILAAGAVALSSALSGDLREAALRDNALDVSAYTEAVLAPTVVRGNQVVVSRAARRRLARTLRVPNDVRGLNVYTRNGRLAFSTTRPDRVGRRRSSPALREAIETGAPSADLLDPIEGSPVVKVWAPLHSARGRVVGAAEVSLDDSVVNQIIDDARGTVWFAVGIVFGVLWLVLALLVRGASARLRAQNDDLAERSHDLVESSRELEATLLETIETLREHVTRGAEIVARISSLRDSVPAIRHHHERWDGLGYPDRLSGTAIPVEAAIIAIADSWDAMTTDRPYAVALNVDEAMLQIQAGRGKQFNPAVVDAFLAVAERRPAEVIPPETPSAAVAAAS